jgi:hypothetical protein
LNCVIELGSHFYDYCCLDEDENESDDGDVESDNEWENHPVNSGPNDKAADVKPDG